MSDDLIKLTAYFGERHRARGRFAAEAVAEAFAARGLKLGIVLRGIAGFGAGHHLREDRRLTLSEDLPLVAVGLDHPGAIDAVIGEIAAIGLRGLLTLERALARPPAPPAEQIKLTIYVGRHQRSDGAPLHQLIVAELRAHGFDAAIVLLGVDGSVAGSRRRAQFLSANTDVPLMVMAVGGAEGLVPVLAAVGTLVPDPLMSVERVTICGRAGEALAIPPADPPHRRGEVWQKLTIYTTEAARSGDGPAHVRLLHDLRRAGARGATTLRGVWGFHDGGQPGGDRLLQLRREVPLVTVTVDTPERIAAVYPHVVAATACGGVVTSEWVPAFRAGGPEGQHGRLELAEL